MHFCKKHRIQRGRLFVLVDKRELLSYDNPLSIGSVGQSDREQLEWPSTLHDISIHFLFLDREKGRLITQAAMKGDLSVVELTSKLRAYSIKGKWEQGPD